MIKAYFDAYFNKDLIPVMEIIDIEAPGTEAELEAALFASGLVKLKDNVYMQPKNNGLNIKLLITKVGKHGYRLKRKENATKDPNAYNINANHGLFEYIRFVPGFCVFEMNGFIFFENNFKVYGYEKSGISLIRNKKGKQMKLQFWLPVIPGQLSAKEESLYLEACEKLVKEEPSYKDCFKYTVDGIYCTVEPYK